LEISTHVILIAKVVPIQVLVLVFCVITPEEIMGNWLLVAIVIAGLDQLILAMGDAVYKPIKMY
jgi:hypothetical protein